MKNLTEKILEQEYGFVCPEMGEHTTEDGKPIILSDWYFKKDNFEIWWIFTGQSTVDIFFNNVQIKNLPMIKYCEDLEYIYKLVTGIKLTKI